MKKIKITVAKKVRHDDLIARYENPLENPCDMAEGQIFIVGDCPQIFWRQLNEEN